jgi:hypothetical protein
MLTEFGLRIADFLKDGLLIFTKKLQEYGDSAITTNI